MSNNPSGLSDEKLVDLAKAGDARAFEELYDRYASGVAKTVESFAGPDRDTIDDLTQEVFFKVIKNISSYSPSHPFANWLFTIALNTGRNHARKRSKIIFLDNDDIETLAAKRMDERSNEALAGALMRRVTRLPVQMIDVVSLRISAGMSYGEIGIMLGIPEGTARSRMHGALQILRADAGIQPTENNAKKEKR